MSSNEILAIEAPSGPAARGVLFHVGLSAAAHLVVLGLSMQAARVLDPDQEETARTDELRALIFRDGSDDAAREQVDLTHDGEGRALGGAEIARGAAGLGLGATHDDEGSTGIDPGEIGTLGQQTGRDGFSPSGDGERLGGGEVRRGAAPRPSHRSSWPTYRGGGTGVLGRLPPELIQRVVRQNFGRFRLCYENGFRWSAPLFGRVSVRFVIGRDGSVLSAQNAGDTIPGGGVVPCVLRAFSALSFPRPEGGIVIVTYPILFEPGG